MTRLLPIALTFSISVNALAILLAYDSYSRMLSWQSYAVSTDAYVVHADEIIKGYSLLLQSCSDQYVNGGSVGQTNPNPN
jgi:hypothetical protein